MVKFHQIELNNPYNFRIELKINYSIKMCKDYSIQFDGILLLIEICIIFGVKNY